MQTVFSPNKKASDEQQLMSTIWSPKIADDPEAFVLYVYPWGKAGTPLEGQSGPRKWQRDELRRIRDHIAQNRVRMEAGLTPLVYNSATSSGRGIGKSALTSWLIHWAMSCRVGGTVIVTANTEQQLKSKTWAELGKWMTLAINTHWFERGALKMKPAPWFEAALKNQLKIDTGYYYAEAQLWSEERPDAFAGAHNPLGMLVLMDEASGIPSEIWTVTEGFFTEPVLHRYWFVFSNPRRNTGAFFDCFHKHREFWNTRNVDGRTVEGTDPAVYEKIIKAHGDDSDEARVEVKGEFPRTGDRQFIGRQVVEDAVNRQLERDDYAALVMGVDPARFGDDWTVIRFRQGRNGRVIPPVKLKGADNMEVANTCAHLINKHRPDGVFVDAGNGTGIIDRLREMGFKVHEVMFGSKSPQKEYANLRTYIWAEMREWLLTACIDDDRDLVADLVAPEYKFMSGSDRMILESKEDMKRRGLNSPDNADALACTFAAPVARKDRRMFADARSGRVAKGVDYDPLGG